MSFLFEFLATNSGFYKQLKIQIYWWSELHTENLLLLFQLFALDYFKVILVQSLWLEQAY